jgi:MFS family permease
MSIGIFSIAFMPGFATIGLLAPVFVLLGRLVQGFSAGMELGGVSVYLSEIAAPGHKGFYVTWHLTPIRQMSLDESDGIGANG